MDISQWLSFNSNPPPSFQLSFANPNLGSHVKIVLVERIAASKDGKPQLRQRRFGDSKVGWRFFDPFGEPRAWLWKRAVGECGDEEDKQRRRIQLFHQFVLDIIGSKSAVFEES